VTSSARRIGRSAAPVCALDGRLMLTFSEVFTYDLPRPARESSDRPRVFPSLPTRAALADREA